MRSFMTAIATVLLTAVAGAVPAASQDHADECRVSTPDGEIAGSAGVVQVVGGALLDRIFAPSSPGIACRSAADGALADDVELIRFDPKGPHVYRNRGVAHPVRSDLGRSIARYSKIIMLDPKDDDAYFRRGIANFYAGSLPKALADISQASELDPKYAYYALWHDIIDKRSNRASRLAPATAQFDMTKWPAPLVRLFLGQTTPGPCSPPPMTPRAIRRRSKSPRRISLVFCADQVEKEAARLFRSRGSRLPARFRRRARRLRRAHGLRRKSVS